MRAKEVLWFIGLWAGGVASVVALLGALMRLVL
ncbi:MAG: DUF2474 domain-containing protein [Pseudomonadota bacterium]